METPGHWFFFQTTTSLPKRKASLYSNEQMTVDWMEMVPVRFLSNDGDIVNDDDFTSTTITTTTTTTNATTMAEIGLGQQIMFALFWFQPLAIAKSNFLSHPSFPCLHTTFANNYLFFLMMSFSPNYMIEYPLLIGNNNFH